MAENETLDIWALLEQDDPKTHATQALYSWSLNYDAGEGPFTLFLDLIGWSEDEYGEALYSLSGGSALGVVELDKLGAALQEYATRPDTVRAYVTALLEAEQRG